MGCVLTIPRALSTKEEKGIPGGRNGMCRSSEPWMQACWKETEQCDVVGAQEHWDMERVRTVGERLRKETRTWPSLQRPWENYQLLGVL